MAVILACLAHLLTVVVIVNRGETNKIDNHPKPPNTSGKTEYLCKPWPSNRYWSLPRFGRKCYAVSKHKASWDEARESCSREGGRLLHIPSSDVNTHITGIRNLEVFSVCLWIGATDRAEEGNWRWSDGSNVSFNDWDFGFWHFVQKWTMHCAELCRRYSNSRSWYWSDFECGYKMKFLCEYEAKYVPVVDKEIPDATPSANPNIRKSMFIRLPRGNSTRLLYKPDMVTTAALSTACARKCSKLGTKCTIFNYNSVTKECVGFFSREVLKEAKERSENWDIFEEGF